MKRTLFLLAAALGAAAPLAAQSGRAWQPGDRVLVTRFAEVGAVAADLRTVYAASELGLERYDYVRRRFQPPITVLDGYPVVERPVAVAVEPGGASLWLATAAGGLYSCDLAFGRLRRVPVSTPGPISALVAARDGIWIYAQPDWLRLRTGSFFPEPVPPALVPTDVRAAGLSPLQQAARTDPFLRSALGSLEVNERLRHYPITSAAPADRPGAWWLGTWGGNVLRFDGHSGEAERLEFGLVSSGVSALATDGKALWFGGDGRDRFTGVTRASTDLGEWRSWESRDEGAPDGAVLAILPAGDATWFAASDGLYRLDARSGRFTRLDERDGLPSGDVRALAPAPGGVWAGTRQGLAFVSEQGRVQAHWLAGRAVQQLAVSGDTLWISSEAGLLLLPGVSAAFSVQADSAAGDSTRAGATAIVPAAEAGALRGQVLAALPAAGAAWALTPDALWRREAGGGWVPVRDGTLATIGRPLTLAAAPGAVWVAGATGIARWDTRSGAWRSWTVGPDLPAGPVRAVLPLGDDVWAATPAGAVRLPLRF